MAGRKGHGKRVRAADEKRRLAAARLAGAVQAAALSPHPGQAEVLVEWKVRTEGRSASLPGFTLNLRVSSIEEAEGALAAARLGVDQWMKGRMADTGFVCGACAGQRGRPRKLREEEDDEQA